jgi:hypothetical protein
MDATLRALTTLFLVCLLMSRNNLSMTTFVQGR